MTARARFAQIFAIVRRPDTIAVILLLAIATVLAQLQQTPDTGASLDSYSTYDAKSGGYRAWYQLAKNEHVTTSTFEQHHVLLDRSLPTLVYSEPVDDDPRALELSPTDLADLQSWVRDGGHLVYLGHDDGGSQEGYLGLPGTVPATPGPKTSPTPLPGGLHGILDRNAAASDFEKRQKKYRVPCACVVGSLTIAPALRARGVETLLPKAELRLFPPSRGKHYETLAGDSKGAFAMRYPFGRGTVTALVDETMFSNGRISLGDHARLAYELIAPGPVAWDEMQHGYFVPQQWYEVVPRPFAIAIGIAILAILIAIAGASIRLGPPVLPFEREPTSVEFIDSLAGLFQRNRAARAALEDAVVSVRRTVATSLGLLASTPLDVVLLRLRGAEDRSDFAELVHMPALPTIDDATLVRGLALAQRLRKDYAHGRR